MKRNHVVNTHRRRRINGVMDSIKKEINTDYIVNLLNNYIDYQNKYHLTEEEKRSVLKFIVFLMYEGDVSNE